jgi:hypothetical protein
MAKQFSFLSFLIVLVPLTILLFCSGGFDIEMFSPLIGEELKQDFKQKLNSLKYFHPKNVKPEDKIASEPIHAPQENVDEGFVMPFQIETFENDDWKKLRFYHDQNVRPYLIGTNPIHGKEINENGEEVIEGFSLMDMFSKPNNDINLDDLSIPHGDDITKSLKNIKIEPNVRNPRTLANGMPTGTAQSNLEAQFLNKLTKTTENSALNKMLEKQAMANSQKAVPIINVKPQSIVKNVPDKSDFQKKFECQFFNGTCPSGWSSNGSFTLSGLGSGISVKCGGDNTKISSTIKPCKCVAEVVDKKVKKIHITDTGSGYSVYNVPEITIKSRNGKGSGALAEAIVDDSGKVKVITIIDEGSGYTETPIVEIGNSMMEQQQQINLCCK